MAPGLCTRGDGFGVAIASDTFLLHDTWPPVLLARLPVSWTWVGGGRWWPHISRGWGGVTRHAAPGCVGSPPPAALLSDALRSHWPECAAWASCGMRSYLGTGLLVSKRCSLHGVLRQSETVDPTEQRENQIIDENTIAFNLSDRTQWKWKSNKCFWSAVCPAQLSSVLARSTVIIHSLEKPQKLLEIVKNSQVERFLIRTMFIHSPDSSEDECLAEDVGWEVVGLSPQPVWGCWSIHLWSCTGIDLRIINQATREKLRLAEHLQARTTNERKVIYCINKRDTIADLNSARQ